MRRPVADQRPSRASWRGVAEVDADEAAERMTAARLGGGSKRLLRELLAPYKRAIQILIVDRARRERRAARRSPTSSRRASTTASRRSGSPTTSSRCCSIVGIVLVATIIQAVARQLFLVRSGAIGQDVLFEVRRRVFRHFQVLSPAFHDDYTSGRVISRQTSDVDAIYEMLETGFDGLVTAALTLVGTAGLLLFLDVQARAWSRCCCGPFLSWLTNWFRTDSAESYKVTREKVALVIVHFVESMGGIRAVQAFRREPRNQEIFDDVNDQYRRANLVAFRLVAWFMPGIRLIGNVTIAVVLVYGGYLAYHGEVTVGVLAAFLLYLRLFFEPMMEISQFYNTFQSASAALEKLAGVLDEQPDVPEPERPGRRSTGRRGELRFDHVRFSYVEGRPVLPDLDLTVPAGQTLALVGTTGAGKTTLAKLATRFYDPVGGRVLLDGIDLRELTSDNLRRKRRDGHPGELPLLRHHRRQHPLRPPRGDHGGGRARHHRAGRPRLHQRAARRLRDRRRQPGRPAQRRSAPAGGVRPGVPRRPGGADPRRGDVVARRPVRAAGPAGAAHGARRPDRGDHRPPALDGGDRRPGAGDGARPDRRGRHAGRPGRRRRRPLLRPAPGLARLARLGESGPS